MSKRTTVGSATYRNEGHDQDQSRTKKPDIELHLVRAIWTTT